MSGVRRSLQRVNSGSRATRRTEILAPVRVTSMDSSPTKARQHRGVKGVHLPSRERQEQYLRQAGRSADLTYFTKRHPHFRRRYVSAMENIVG
jgi:hypothetical protein